MAARTPKAPNKAPGKAGGAKKPTPAPTRAQLKAMEARAASAARATAFARGEDVDDTPERGRAATTTRSGRAARGAGRSGVRAGAERGIGAYPMPEFSVRTEMEYHRRDLIRLLIVAAVLLVIYIVLWFFLH
jgi:hypothetical protein